MSIDNSSSIMYISTLIMLYHIQLTIYIICNEKLYFII